MFGVLAFGVAGCITPPSQAQRLADSAFEMNNAARFGRFDLAIEQVAPSAREDYARRHAAWGRSVRVVDVELSGIRWIDQSHAEVSLHVSWLGAAEADLRDTQLSQRWQDDHGTWQMTSEERVSGSAGLFHKHAPAGGADDDEASAKEAASSRRSAFRTRVIASE